MSVPGTREEILSLANELWGERDNLTVDQVDGAFYFGICLKDRLAEIEREARMPDKSPWYFGLQQKAILPHTRGSWLWGEEYRPGLRDAVVTWSNRIGTLLTPEGAMTGYAPKTHQSWIRIAVQNAEWKGIDVENALARKVGQFEDRETRLGIERPPLAFLGRVPSLTDDEALTFIGLRLLMNPSERQFWDPETGTEPHIDMDAITREYIRRVKERHEQAGDFGPVPRPDGSLDQELTDEANKVLREHMDALPHEEVTWGPEIIVTVPVPIPPRGVIAAFYDAVAIQERGWNAHLLGKVNGQGVDVAIRVWAIALIEGLGERWLDATRAVEDELNTQASSQDVYRRQKAELFRRVPETKALIQRS